MDLAERGEKASYLIKDGDTKFAEKFGEVFRGEGIKVKRLPYRFPNLNAYAEMYVQTARVECLDNFVVFGERHLEYLLREYEAYYNTVRPHQGLRNRTIGGASPLPQESESLDPTEVECDSRLGGLLRLYHRKAA
jgi:putative transposase